MYSVARIIRAKYEKGVLRPLEELDLRESEEVIVRIERREVRGLAELVEKLRKETPEVDNPVAILEELRR